MKSQKKRTISDNEEIIDHDIMTQEDVKLISSYLLQNNNK